MTGTIKKDMAVVTAVFVALAVFAGYITEMNHYKGEISKLNDQLYNSSTACSEDLNNLLDIEPNFYTSEKQQQQYCEGQPKQ